MNGKNRTVLWIGDTTGGTTRKFGDCPWCGEEFLKSAVYETGTNNFAVAWHDKCSKCTKLENDAKAAEFGLKRLAQYDPSI